MKNYKIDLSNEMESVRSLIVIDLRCKAKELGCYSTGRREYDNHQPYVYIEFEYRHRTANGTAFYFGETDKLFNKKTYIEISWQKFLELSKDDLKIDTQPFYEKQGENRCRHRVASPFSIACYSDIHMLTASKIFKIFKWYNDRGFIVAAPWGDCILTPLNIRNSVERLFNDNNLGEKMTKITVAQKVFSDKVGRESIVVGVKDEKSYRNISYAQAMHDYAVEYKVADMSLLTHKEETENWKSFS